MFFIAIICMFCVISLPRLMYRSLIILPLQRKRNNCPQKKTAPDGAVCECQKFTRRSMPTWRGLPRCAKPRFTLSK